MKKHFVAIGLLIVAILVVFWVGLNPPHVGPTLDGQLEHSKLDSSKWVEQKQVARSETQRQKINNISNADVSNTFMESLSESHNKRTSLQESDDTAQAYVESEEARRKQIIRSPEYRAMLKQLGEVRNQESILHKLYDEYREQLYQMSLDIDREYRDRQKEFVIQFHETHGTDAEIDEADVPPEITSEAKDRAIERETRDINRTMEEILVEIRALESEKELLREQMREMLEQ